MSTKSELKKRFILEKSKQVFIAKGYQAVTMTDIVEICEISRGGLYRYYKNTTEIFLEVLRMEQEETGYAFSDAMEKGMSGIAILDQFLQEQKKELLVTQKSLTVATYEFFFMNRDISRKNILQQQFDAAVKIVAELIQYGMDRGEFIASDTKAVARNIILLIEGIRVSSEVMNVTEDLLDEQLHCIKKVLINGG